MAEERGTENATPWWRSFPAMLTAAATFIGSVAALLALFVGPGDGDQGSSREPQGTPPATSTPTEVPTGSSIPLKNELGANVDELLTMVPAPLRGRCEHAPDAGGGAGDELATLWCRIGGADFYYHLYAHELDALEMFRIVVSNEENYSLDGKAADHAPSCGEARAKRPFVGTWTRLRQSGPAGQQLCSYSSAGSSRIAWTETGRPILGETYYSGRADGAEAVWEQVVRG
jgi:hypothetical protein